jgi:hypothetical protein
MPFPLEILYAILDHIDLDKIALTCVLLAPGISDDELHRIVIQRKSITRYLRQISSDPPELLNMMRKTSSFLIGPRAVNFLRPLNGIENSPWCFACQANVLSNYRLMQYFKSRGVVWKTTKTTSMKVLTRSTRANIFVFNSYLEGTIVIDNDVNIIRLVWACTREIGSHDQLHAITPMEYFILLGCNISQCMISYLGAFGLSKAAIFGNRSTKFQSIIADTEDHAIYTKNKIDIYDAGLDMTTVGRRVLCDDHSIYVSLDKHYKPYKGKFRQVRMDKSNITWSWTRIPNSFMPYNIHFGVDTHILLSLIPKSLSEAKMIQSIEVNPDYNSIVDDSLGPELDTDTKHMIVYGIKKDIGLQIPF